MVQEDIPPSSHPGRLEVWRWILFLSHQKFITTGWEQLPNRSLGTFANWLVMSVYLQRKWPAAYTKMSSYLSCVISTPSWDERPGCWRKTWLAAFAWFSAPTNGVWKLTHVATAFERWRWDCCVWSWRPSWATQLQASRQARLYTHTHTLYS